MIGTRTDGTAISLPIVMAMGGKWSGETKYCDTVKGIWWIVTTDRRLGQGSFEIDEQDEEERYNRENRAIPTIPFRRKVNFSRENFWHYFLS